MSWKKEKKKGRKIEERTKFVRWYSSWMRAEYARSWGEKSRRLRDRQCNRIIRTGYRLSILIHTYIYIHAYIYIYTPLCVHLGSVSTHSSWKLPVTLRYLSVKNHPRSPKSRKHIPPFLSSPPPFAYESELGVRDGRGGWPPLRGMIGGGRRGGERERYIWRNRYTCLVYANYKLASRAKFFIFRITGQFWDCWKVSLSLFYF